MADWTTKSFHIPSDDSSYFGKVREDEALKIRKEINNQVRKEANEVIHKIVTQKDSEINDLNSKVVKLEEELKRVRLKKTEPQVIKVEVPTEVPTEYVKGNITEEFSSSDDLQIINNALFKAIKFGQHTEDNLKDENLEKLLTIIVSWKNFFEEYKWKSNYISTKIKKLLKETDEKL